VINIEMDSVLTLSDGSAPRQVTIRVHDLRQDSEHVWSVAVDIVGFKTDDHTRAYGADWLNAVEGALIVIRTVAGGKVKDYGATITPLLLPP
jgi:hypothetical protein